MSQLLTLGLTMPTDMALEVKATFFTSVEAAQSVINDITGDDIRRNVLSSNALGLVYIYTERINAVTRARWDGTEVCAVPLAIDVVDHVKRCLGAVK